MFGEPGSRSARTLAAVLVWLLSVSGAAHSADFRPLTVVAQPGPWSDVSRLISYANQVWFVNSIKFVNHNSADVYSFDPVKRSAHYQRHLFSQDTGDPTVHEGLLYWPFEDARFSAGNGELMVTNGVDWGWREIPEGLVFHTHAIHPSDNTLYAATSGWIAQLHRYDHQWAQWQMFYEHPTAEQRVSRITSLASLHGNLYAALTSRTEKGPKLLVVKDDQVFPHAGWPDGTGVTALETFGGWLYAVNTSGETRKVWRTDGNRVEPVAGLDRVVVREFAAGKDYLWAVSGRQGKGALWRTRDGISWQRAQSFDDAVPLAVTTHEGDVYVGTRGPGNSGALWGPATPSAAPRHQEPRPALPRFPIPGNRDVSTLTARLDKRLQYPDDFGRYRQQLQTVLTELASTRETEACGAIQNRLTRPYDERPVSAIGGLVTMPFDHFNQWYLLRALLMCGKGQVPTELLHIEWSEVSNRSEKYFSPLPGAAWVAGELGSADESTVAALIGQLGRAPDFVDGDLVGALTLTTGQSHGYDLQAWKGWWAARQDMVAISAGEFQMGSQHGGASEGPVHRIFVSSYFLDGFEVTNDEFSEFVEETGYVTDVERAGEGWHWGPAWRKVPGANWRRPHGPGSSIDGLERHPVVQVSWNDAKTFCHWQGKRLPTEAEWEHAARGAEGRLYAWGNEPPGGKAGFRASSGTERCCAASEEDGFLYTAPVGSFPRSHPELALFDLTGNVWEWVQDSYAPDYYQHSPEPNPVNLDATRKKVIRGGGWGNNPWGLRATLRHANPANTGLSMVGIRCAL